MWLHNLGLDGGAIAPKDGGRARSSLRVKSFAGRGNSKGLEKLALHGVSDCLKTIVGIKLLINVV